MTHEAGRELDALIAEKVMGQPHECSLVGAGTKGDPMRIEPLDGVWRVRSPQDDYWYRWSPGGSDRIVNDFAVLHYSTDIAAAWEVVEKLCALEFFPEIHRLNDGDWRCEVRSEHPMDVWEDAPTAPLAICKAALAALGHS